MRRERPEVCSLLVGHQSTSSIHYITPHVPTPILRCRYGSCLTQEQVAKFSRHVEEVSYPLPAELHGHVLTDSDIDISTQPELLSGLWVIMRALRI